MSYSINKTSLGYILIGIVNSIFGYFFIFLFIYSGIQEELSNLLGYILGISWSYYLNKKYNFKSSTVHKQALPRFFVSMVVAYIVNISIFSFFYRILDINVYVSTIVGGVFYTFVGYFMSYFWVFGRKNANKI
jgi:putative flippase GtrA